MADIHVIRHLQEREGWSVRRIAREFRMSRKTVTKYLNRASTDPVPQYQRHQPARAPQMDAYRVVIDAWLTDDLDAPRKQRHTAHRIWQRLHTEYGATVAESTVRHYVAGRRRVLQPLGQAAFLDLEFDPGEMAQVDWGTVHIVLNGEPQAAQIFCMRLAYSGAVFVQPESVMELMVKERKHALRMPFRLSRSAPHGCGPDGFAE